MDVLLVSMPFGPLLSPSLGLSLLQPQIRARGLSCDIVYFTLPYAERIGQPLYSKILNENRSMARGFAGEWIFSHALFDWPRAHDDRYVREILLAPPSWLGRNATRPPGTRDIAALRKAARNAAAFVDWCADRVLEQRPRIVGLTSVFQQHLGSLALAKRIKERWPDTFVVMGGANCEATMGLETVRQFAFVDAIVSGEADAVIGDVVERIVGGHPIDDVPGVITRRSTTPPTAVVKDMDALPFPDYTTYFDQFASSRFAKSWQPSVYVETSRGCWWGERMHCTFCGLNGATMAYRAKSAERALDELTHLATSYPGSDIQVVDNILDLKYFKTLLPMLVERKLNVSLFYETKSNLKKEQVRLLRDAGVTIIQPGIESFSDAVLKQMKKGVSGLQNVQVLKWCKEIGVDPLWNLLLGFPGEAPADYAKMAELMLQVCHLPEPVGVTAIRLDRFSPNFNDSNLLGFTKVRPLPFYEFIYDLPEPARRNLAYYFAYDYKSPQTVAEYADPLVRRVHAWKTTWKHSELVSIDFGDRLVIVDTRPKAASTVTTLRDADRELYLAGDAILDRSQLNGSASRADALVAKGLMLNDGSRYLSLAIPIGEYAPSGEAAARLRATLGARRSKQPLTRDRFTLSGDRVQVH
ncbi:MAG TPA: RiPP maturation radical SAM C-methyltransferase [Vicinamibacterales bacterium]|nr:RiPP maturation radical SAM C-methyltransferase [Vicinamibacterales bacterium]